MPQKFYMVWLNDSPTTRVRHPSLDQACDEADRIARLNPGKKVYVLEALDFRVEVMHPLRHEVL